LVASSGFALLTPTNHYGANSAWCSTSTIFADWQISARDRPNNLLRSFQLHSTIAKAIATSCFAPTGGSRDAH